MRGTTEYSSSWDDKLTKVTYGNGARTEYVYYSAGALSKISHFANGGTLFASVAYEYDLASNVTKATLADNLTYKGDATVTYQYDNLHRLTREYCTPGNNSARREYGYDYAYDAVGNRTKMVFHDGPTTDITTTYEYSSRNELTKMTTGGNDTLCYFNLRGNLTKKGDTEYYWSSGDKLTKVYDGSKTVEYKYDLMGRRVAKRVNGGDWKWYFYDGLQVIVEGTSATSHVAYTNSPSIIGGIITRGDGSTTYTYHFDRLGNVMAVTDSNGTPYALYTMGSFGSVLEKGTSTGYFSEHQTDPQSYHLTTKEYDTDSGIYYFAARWYDPAAGAFLSQDASRMAWTTGMSTRHSYCSSAPNALDPTGKECIEVPFALPLLKDSEVKIYKDHVGEFFRDDIYGADGILCPNSHPFKCGQQCLKFLWSPQRLRHLPSYSLGPVTCKCENGRCEAIRGALEQFRDSWAVRIRVFVVLTCCNDLA
jgi:RHS repeat-associated protein